MVDLAASGLIDGKSSILASAALDETSLQQAVLNAPEVIVTDSNRKRAHQWRGSQEVWGATEGVGSVVDSFDAFDNRLPVFPSTTGPVVILARVPTEQCQRREHQNFMGGWLGR
jgi:arabinofuranan 3-O-arabinosyltransferase